MEHPDEDGATVYWHPFLTQFLRQDYGNLLDNREGYSSYIGYLIELHGDLLMEVLMMRQMTAEEIDLDMETVIRFLKFYSDDKVKEGLRKLYGDEKIIQWINE